MKRYDRLARCLAYSQNNSDSRSYPRRTTDSKPISHCEYTCPVFSSVLHASCRRDLGCHEGLPLLPSARWRLDGPRDSQPVSFAATYREAGRSARIIFRRVTQNGESMIYRTGVSLASCLVSERDPMRPPSQN